MYDDESRDGGPLPDAPPGLSPLAEEVSAKPPAVLPQGPPYPYAHRFIAAALSWFFPGAGHLFLRRRGRALAFVLLIALALATGFALDGKLYTRVPGDLFATLGTLGCMGLGPLYFLARGYPFAQGDLLSPWAEYGNRFVLLAGVMSLLVMLDAFDVAVGRREPRLEEEGEDEEKAEEGPWKEDDAP
jgi:hypothetical protein